MTVYDGGMQIRHAHSDDFTEILAMYQEARTYMHSHGNPHQWTGGYPSESVVRSDLEAQRLYIVEDASSHLVGVFVFFVGEEPTYSHISLGSWPDNKPYGVVHRIASKSGTHGVGSFALDWAWRKSGRHLRVDTHRDNMPMQRLLHKLGFLYCGIIYLADGSERLAFQKN